MTKQLITKTFDSSFDQMSLLDLKHLVDKMINSYGESATICPIGYENYGDFRIRYTVLETDSEFADRVRKENERRENNLRRKKERLKELEKEIASLEKK